MASSYRQHFHDCLLGGIEELLVRIRAAEHLVPEDDRQQAWHLLSYALDVAEAWPATHTLLLTLAPKMEQAGFREDWLPYLQQGLRQSQALNDRSITAECQLQMGLLYRLQSKFDLARQQLTASVTGFAALHARHDQARALNELAWLDHLQHRYVEATRRVEEALALLNDEDPERAMCYRVLGMVAIDQGRWQAAEEFHRQALLRFEQQKNRRKIAWSRQNLAYALQGQSKFEDAIYDYQQAGFILDEIGDANHLGVVHMNLGNLYKIYGDKEKSKEHHIKAHAIFSILNDRFNLAKIYTCLGNDYLALQNYQEAENFFRLSIDLYKLLNDEGWRLNAMDGLATVYLTSKEYTKAIDVLEQAVKALPAIADLPNYNYLHISLNEHLDEARQGQGLFLR